MPILTAAEPQLFVRDISAASEFYARKLGFSVAFTYGEPPFYAQVFRDGARLNLRQVDDAVLDAIRRATDELLSATVTLDDAKPLFRERRYGLVLAILITGTMFAVSHLDFTLVLWPYYVAVAAIYGTVTSLADSILPAVVLHTGGNIYSNLDLWLHGQAEWQAASLGAESLVWATGADTSFWIALVAVVVVSAAMVAAYVKLAHVARRSATAARAPAP